MLTVYTSSRTSGAHHTHVSQNRKILTPVFSIYNRDLPVNDIFRVTCELHSMRSVVLVLPSFYIGKMATIVRPCIVAGLTENELWSKIRLASHAHKPLPPPPSNADRGSPVILSAITGAFIICIDTYLIA